MLQQTQIQFSIHVFGLCWILSLFLACRQDNSSISEEQQSYLADYESPANKWGFINNEGNLVVPARFDDVGMFHEGKAAVCREGLWGYIDTDGDWVIEPNYRSAWQFREELARVKPFDGLAHYVRPNGYVVRSADWEAEDDFFHGRARIRYGTLFGYIDTTGHMLIRPVYESASNFNDGVAIVEYDKKFGLIDRQGLYILQPQYEKIKKASASGLIIASYKKGTVIIDTTGKEILHATEGNIPDTDGKRYVRRDRDGDWLCDITNKKTLHTDPYRLLRYLTHDRWLAKSDSGYSVVNLQGEVITQHFYQQINNFAEGFAAVSRGNGWGYIDTLGRELTPMHFGLAWDYKNGYARAAFVDGIAYLNLTQEVNFYPPSGSLDIRDFSEGLAPVQISR